MGAEKNFVVITGVSKGLGNAMAHEFIKAGHTVAGCARSVGSIQELSKRYGAPHSFRAVDVTHATEVEQWAKALLQTHSSPDLLVNNAALINRNAPLWEMTPEEFGGVIDANIKGVFHVIRAFVPAMVRRNHGVIVNFSSGWGRSTAAEVAPYCATKWAVEGLTQAMAQELPSGMAAVALNPGIIDTEMLRSCFGSSASMYPKAETWAKTAAPYLLTLGPRHNGQALTAPG